MANEADMNLEELRAERLREQYHAFQSDQERLNWLIDLYMIEGHTNSQYFTHEKSNVLRELAADFFNPRKGNGKPDHEKYAERVDLFFMERIRNRTNIGRLAQKKEKDGLFSGGEDRSYYTSMESEYGLRDQSVEAIQIAMSSSEMEFWEPYANRRGISQLSPDELKLPTQKVKGLKEARFMAAVKEHHEVLQKGAMDKMSDEDRSALQHYYHMNEKHLERPGAIFTKDELEQLDAYGKEKRGLYIKHALENTPLEKDFLRDTMDVIAQFDTKRSWIFFGRESQEHADLKEAALMFQTRLKTYQASGNLSHAERLNAIEQLESAAAKMEELVDAYEEKKGSVSTSAGFSRLMGAMNLKQIGKEVVEHLSVVRERLHEEIMDRAVEVLEENDKNNVGENLEKKGEEKEERREEPQNIIRSEEAHAGARRETNVEKLGSKLEKKGEEKVKENPAEVEAKERERHIEAERKEWKEAEKRAGNKSEAYSELSAEMEKAWKSEGTLKEGSKPDKQLRSAIGALDLKENQGWFGPTNYDNTAVIGVNDTKEAVAQVIAIQSLYAKDKDLHARGVDQTRLNWEMKRIQEMPGFNQMMENYAKEPGSLTRLARNNPAQLWQEMLRTEQKILTGQDPKMEPRKPDGKEAYPHQTSHEIRIMGRDKQTGARKNVTKHHNAGEKQNEIDEMEKG